MQASIIEIKKTDKDRIDEIAKVHLAAFDGFFLSFMGEAFLKKMYQSYIEHEASGILVAEVDGKTAGTLAYSYDVDSLYRFMSKKHSLEFAKSMIKPLLKKPGTIVKKTARFFAGKKENEKEKILKLSSICVLPNCQRKGIGTALVNHFLSNTLREGYRVSLDTDEINNDGTQLFYKSLGFVEKRRFETPDGRRMIEFTYENTNSWLCEN